MSINVHESLPLDTRKDLYHSVQTGYKIELCQQRLYNYMKASGRSTMKMPNVGFAGCCGLTD